MFFRFGVCRVLGFYTVWVFQGLGFRVKGLGPLEFWAFRV